MIDPRIKEQNYGVYEGASRFDEGFLNNKKSFAIHYPGGESQMSTAARVYAFLEDIAQKYPEESVLLVCHGGICRHYRKLLPRYDQRGVLPVQRGQLPGAGV